jgi:hypothetical protein
MLPAVFFRGKLVVSLIIPIIDRTSTLFYPISLGNNMNSISHLVHSTLDSLEVKTYLLCLFLCLAVLMFYCCNRDNPMHARHTLHGVTA